MLVFRIIKNNSPIALGRERTSKMNKPVSFGIPFLVKEKSIRKTSYS